MLRLVSAALRGGANKIISKSLINLNNVEPKFSPQIRSLLTKQFQNSLSIGSISNNVLSNSVNKLLTPQVQIPTVPCRSVVKYSLRKGKRKTVKTVILRFFRLNWGMWIRTKAGRHKHLWKKSSARRRRLRQHVFTNSTQSWMLDKMVTSFWRRPKYWVDDPYAPYHTREEFLITRRKPLPIPEE